MNLAIVPARGGSKRLKDKNIAPLGALPLIYYSLTAIIDSQCFDKVVVTTDCQKIKKAIQIFNKNAKFKVCIHDRPSKFATDESSALEAVLEYLDQRLENPSKVGYFLPTCPLISFQDIQQGMARLTDAYDFCISVTNMGDPIQLAMSMSTKTGGLYPVTDNLSLGKVNSRFITQHYKPSGGF
jgi:N-acylneuraminate cytidylyltransferase